MYKKIPYNKKCYTLLLAHHAIPWFWKSNQMSLEVWISWNANLRPVVRDPGIIGHHNLAITIPKLKKKLISTQIPSDIRSCTSILLFNLMWFT